MKHIWILAVFCAVVCFTGEKVKAQSPSTGDDLYLDNQASGDFPVDDDDFNSGSGSGYSDDEDEPRSRAFSTPEPEVTPDGPEATSPSTDTSEETKSESDGEKTAKDRGLGTEAPLEVTEDSPLETEPSSSPIDRHNGQNLHNVRSENLFQRTEVLAAVIAGGVIGFLFALFLILLLVYRMRKKDEGSYDLGERKPPSQPTRRPLPRSFTLKDSGLNQ